MECLEIKNIFEDLSQTLAKELFENARYPWEVLGQIEEFILKTGDALPKDEYEERKPRVWVAKSAKVAPTAFLGAPLIIGAGTEVRHGAFIRGKALVGEGCVVGNSTELKNVILFNGVQVPHYNYVGDSILGYRSHMGAGSITSNVKADRTLVSILSEGKRVETGLKKMGAVLGDFVEIGCNSVLNPGTVIGCHTNVYPLSMVRGYVKPYAIYKKQGEVAEKR